VHDSSQNQEEEEEEGCFSHGFRIIDVFNVYTERGFGSTIKSGKTLCLFGFLSILALAVRMVRER